MSIRHKIIIGFGVALMMMAIIAVITYRSTRTFIKTAEQVGHTRQVLEKQETLWRYLMEAESAARGYLMSEDESFLEPYDEAQVKIIQEFNTLKTLSVDNRIQMKRLDRLKGLISRKLAVLTQSISTRRSDGLEPAVDIMGSEESHELVLEIRRLMNDFAAEAHQLLNQRSDLTRSIGRMTTGVIVLSALLTVLLLVSACVIILRDIAARRRAEEALAEEHNLLRSVMDAMPNHVYVKDLAGRFVIDNVAHRNFLHMQGIQEVEGKTVFDFYPIETAEEYRREDEGVISTGEPLLCREAPVVDAKGMTTWFSTTKVPLRDIDRHIVGVVCVATDISERKQAEEKLRLAASQLARSNRDLQDFASVASHDLQEPLRKIMAFGDRLKTKCSEALGETGKDYVERMMDAAERMQKLIQSILMLSRVTSRAQPFKLINLREIIDEVVSDLEVRIEQVGAKVEVGKLPEIEADPLQMRQLFQNLVSNALKFQREGNSPVVSIFGKTLQVPEAQISGVSAGAEVCQIMVKDNGIGFDQKFAEQIFAVFQRLHGRFEYEGTGIGLAVCRKITDRHGGSIMAKSEEGAGAIFIVTLPVKQLMKKGNHETK